MMTTPTVTYLYEPPERVPAPRWHAADILGVNGDEPAYPGGLKRYRHNRRAHAHYREWRAQYRKA